MGHDVQAARYPRNFASIPYKPALAAGDGDAGEPADKFCTRTGGEYLSRYAQELRGWGVEVLGRGRVGAWRHFILQARANHLTAAARSAIRRESAFRG